MANIAIVYHSGYGHTESLAHSVKQGAQKVPDTHVLLIEAEKVDDHWEDLRKADAIIFGAPTYMGSASAPFKTFMDKSSKVWIKQEWKDKIAAGFTNSSSQSGDKLNTLVQLVIFAMQHSMVWVGLGLLPGNNSSKGSINDLNRLGSYIGAMAQSNNDEGPDRAPPAADHETAAHLGQRVAMLTHRQKE
ncbi:MAG: flavodoxin family protein [Proteobacteria bacterium]|nr:flavodoxin family protein [Pseudomonadota bacterium]